MIYAALTRRLYAEPRHAKRPRRSASWSPSARWLRSTPTEARCFSRRSRSCATPTSPCGTPAATATASSAPSCSASCKVCARRALLLLALLAVRGRPTQLSHGCVCLGQIRSTRRPRGSRRRPWCSPAGTRSSWRAAFRSSFLRTRWRCERVVCRVMTSDSYPLSDARLVVSTADYVPTSHLWCLWTPPSSFEAAATPGTTAGPLPRTPL